MSFGQFLKLPPSFYALSLSILQFQQEPYLSSPSYLRRYFSLHLQIDLLLFHDAYIVLQLTVYPYLYSWSKP
ncbi:hypothetical protein FGO68_gene4793 [Halteria grandinella]|uniref:Uncharacterized protein n=1 Tax=Halteria grandinella TaxID=5974 RepID=A0A8J8N9C7_HALGN|nr:hypothetical protein FGO68_gene4793 [Halteria grandinella]